MNKELLDVLICSIPSIVEHHFHDMLELQGEYALYYSNNHEALKRSLEGLIFNCIQSLLLDDDGFERFAEALAEESYQEGLQAALNQDFVPHVILESNHNLRIHIFDHLFPIIDKMIPDPAVRMIMTGRINNMASTRFKNYYLGFIPMKDKQITSLHQQKLSIIGQMSAGMAHEIRNPLTTVQGFLQFMKELFNKDTVNKDDILFYLDLCKNELDQIESLVNDFLLLARKSEAVKKEITTLHISDILHRVQELSRYYAVEKSISLDFEYHHGEVEILGVPTYIEQIFLNIIKNGIDASPNNSLFKVKTGINEENQTMVTSFIDFGPGIPESELVNIFEPFFTTKETGTGMGLAICKELVDFMGGSIEVESTIDVGTVFHVQLPLAHT
ncbi:sensor histidine kinase [Brevibacillus dissolubilis]|uniref:sensor histidine kinase n=1 Tax=Brevibacillus dissolubilis TaxID=1844116 RepID=UPI00159BD1C5|nr:HAMP domain-containing sensor histidine kinase [Brevibacillus dissolubilis]